MTVGWKKWLREPLVHFFVLGAFLFLLFDVVGTEDRGERQEIVVAEGTIRSLDQNFQRVWQRPPNTQELNGLIQDYIKEEIFYREAIAMGLDKGDPIVRRRLRQKMEALSDGFASIPEPDDKDLQAYLAKHPEKFRSQSRYTFSHVYLNAEKHGKTLAEDAAELLKKLREAPDPVEPGEYGDEFLQGYYFSNTPESNVARTFGDPFAKALAGLEPGKWAGPLQSVSGLHLVLISNKTEGRLPPLSEIREQVAREWTDEYQKQASQKYYDDLRSRYTIRFENPPKKEDTATQP